MISVKDIKKPFPSLHIRDAFGLTSIDRYFLIKMEIERLETDAKPLVRDQQRNPLKMNVFL